MTWRVALSSGFPRPGGSLGTDLPRNGLGIALTCLPPRPVTPPGTDRTARLAVPPALDIREGL